MWQFKGHCKGFTQLWNSQNRLFRYWEYSAKTFYALEDREAFLNSKWKAPVHPFHSQRSAWWGRKWMVTMSRAVALRHATTVPGMSPVPAVPSSRSISFSCRHQAWTRRPQRILENKWVFMAPKGYSASRYASEMRSEKYDYAFFNIFSQSFCYNHGPNFQLFSGL